MFGLFRKTLNYKDAAIFFCEWFLYDYARDTKRLYKSLSSKSKTQSPYSFETFERVHFLAKHALFSGIMKNYHDSLFSATPTYDCESEINIIFKSKFGYSPYDRIESMKFDAYKDFVRCARMSPDHYNKWIGDLAVQFVINLEFASSINDIDDKRGPLLKDTMKIQKNFASHFSDYSTIVSKVKKITY